MVCYDEIMKADELKILMQTAVSLRVRSTTLKEKALVMAETASTEDEHVAAAITMGKALGIVDSVEMIQKILIDAAKDELHVVA